MVHEAKHHFEFDRPTDVAIDMTYVAYYGDREEVEMIMGTPDSKAYDWCYKFATLTVVGLPGREFAPADTDVVPIGREHLRVGPKVVLGWVGSADTDHGVGVGPIEPAKRVVAEHFGVVGPIDQPLRFLDGDVDDVIV